MELDAWRRDVMAAARKEPPMKQLFKCQTVAQFKLMSWLTSEGVTADDIAEVEPLGPDRLKITNPAGRFMVIRWVDGHAETDPT